MILRCVNSGSSGNCYLLEDSRGDVLILDCGVPIIKIKAALQFKVSKIVGVIVSHSHADHSLSVKDFENMGIPVWKPYEKALKKPSVKCFGSFKTTALPMLDKKMEIWQHSNGDLSQCPCYGFLVENEKLGKLLYITDTKQCAWTFEKSKINHILVGTNYQSEYLSDEKNKRNHVLTGHMSINTCKDMVVKNKTEALKKVLLCHISDESADPLECVAEVQKVAGKGVYVDWARKGLEVELKSGNECPF